MRYFLNTIQFLEIKLTKEWASGIFNSNFSTEGLYQFVNKSLGFPTLALVLVTVSVCGFVFWEIVIMCLSLTDLGDSHLPCDLTSYRDVRSVDFSVCSVYTFLGSSGNFQTPYMPDREQVLHFLFLTLLYSTEKETRYKLNTMLTFSVRYYQFLHRLKLKGDFITLNFAPKA